MSVSNGFITAPVSIEDVKTAIVASSRDLGTLCQYHSESGGVQVGINKWAKYKPVVYANAVTQLSDSQFASVNYGLTAPNQRINVPSTMSDSWVYTPPTGTISAPFRLTDFYHYSHRANNPIRENGNLTPNMFFSDNVTFYFTQSGVVDNYAIVVTDLAAISSFYPAVYITFTYNGQNFAQLITASNTFGNNGASVTIPRTSFSAPNYQTVRNYYLVASSVKYTTLTDVFTSGYFKCLPYKASIDELKGTITWDTTWPLGFTLTHVSSVVTSNWSSSTTMTDASNFKGPEPTMVTNSYYFYVGSTYCFQAKCTVTNNSSESVTLALGSMTYKIEKTFVSSSGTGTNYVNKMWNSSGTSVNSVTIAAGATVTITLGFQDYCLRMDSSNQVITVSQTGQYINTSPNLRFYYKGNQAFTLTCRFRN